MCTVGQHHQTQRLFYNKLLIISCNLLNTLLKEKNRMVIWVRNGFDCISCSPSWWCGWQGPAARCHRSALQECIAVPRDAGPGKNQNSACKVQLLLNVFCFHTIVKSKSFKSNHCTLGIVYSLQFSLQLRAIGKLTSPLSFNFKFPIFFSFLDIPWYFVL